MKGQRRMYGIWALAGALLLALAFKKRAALGQIVSCALYAALFAAMLTPLCRRLEQRGVREGIAALLSVAALALAAVVVVAVFLPYLIAHGIDLIAYMTPTLRAAGEAVSALLARYGVALPQGEGIAGALGASMGRATGALARGGAAFFMQAGRLGFSLVIAYYALCQRRMLANYALLLAPIRWRTLCMAAVLGCKNALSGYLTGVLKTSLFISAAVFVGFTLLGVRDALLLAAFMGVFELLPYIGPVLALIPVVLVTLPRGLFHVLAASALVLLVQQIEGNFVGPYFTASSTSLSPLAALVSVFAFGALFGLWGVVLAIPAVVCIRSIWWSVQSVTI